MTTEERLTTLEQELAATRRRFRWLLVGLALGLGVWVFVRAGGRTVRANMFILEDENGQTRAMLSVTAGRPGLDLYDEKDRLRAILSVVKDGPMLSLINENGEARASLGVLAPGSGLGLFDEAGEIRAGMYVAKEGPSLALRDAAGKMIWSAP